MCRLCGRIRRQFHLKIHCKSLQLHENQSLKHTHTQTHLEKMPETTFQITEKIDGNGWSSFPTRTLQFSCAEMVQTHHKKDRLRTFALENKLRQMKTQSRKTWRFYNHGPWKQLSSLKFNESKTQHLHPTRDDDGDDHDDELTFTNRRQEVVAMSELKTHPTAHARLASSLN